MGPWAHGVGARKVGELDFGDESKLNLSELQMQWFEYWMRGKDTHVEQWPAVKLFVMGENRWRDEHEWPLQRTQYTPYYLRGAGHAQTAQGDGVLQPALPGEEPQDTFLYDPNEPVPSLGGNNLVGAKAGPYDQAEIERRQDVLVYTSAPLTNDLEVTGPVKLVLWATTTAPDTDFTGKLVDVDADGKAYNLCEGILRARWRESRTQARPVQPGEAARYEIDLWVTSNLFRPGHRIRLEVSSSNFPRFDRNPNSGKPFGTDTELFKATQTVYHTAAHASHVILPVIPR
jgi:putative CocE/NonD family hydrolase